MCKPKAALGQECNSDSCVDGAFCQLDLMTGKSICKPRKADGEPCSRDDECTSDQCGDDPQGSLSSPLMLSFIVSRTFGGP